MDDFNLVPDDREESSAKCHLCGQTLTYPELINFGNRCLFCASSSPAVGLWAFLCHAYYDARIYNSIRGWQGLTEPCTECSEGVSETSIGKAPCTACNHSGRVNVGRTRFLGHLGAVGVERYDQLTLKSKRELLKSIRGVK